MNPTANVIPAIVGTLVLTALSGLFSLTFNPPTLLFMHLAAPVVRLLGYDPPIYGFSSCTKAQSTKPQRQFSVFAAWRENFFVKKAKTCLFRHKGRVALWKPRRAAPDAEFEMYFAKPGNQNRMLCQQLTLA